MRIVRATCLVCALVLGCTATPVVILETLATERPGEENDASAPAANEARQDSGELDAAQDSGEPADSGAWFGAGAACDADTDCPAFGGIPGTCLAGYCAGLCVDVAAGGVCGDGGTCRKERLGGTIGVNLCEAWRQAQPR